MNTTAAAARKALAAHADPAKALVLRKFFKTAPGQYGAGDIFIGINVPAIRAISRMFDALSIRHILNLLRSPVHEERLLALLILIRRYEKSAPPAQEQIVGFYLKNSRHINNWDLVDLTAPKIIGEWLKNKPRIILDRLAHSKNMWQRRIAIVSTLTFIRHNDLADTFRIADMLLSDKEDLLHKAAGWMLREAGKRDMRSLKTFLRPRLRDMPRTMLRYAIERFPEHERQEFLKIKKG